MPVRVEIIIATQLSEADFWDKSATALSLRRLEYDDRWVPRVAFANKQGLPTIYNARVDSAKEDSILVFMHDDVWIDDHFFVDRILEGLKVYDVIGVVGNRRIVPMQPAWSFIGMDDNGFIWDDFSNFSGLIAHGQHPFGNINLFGSVPAECELLDGVFLATTKQVLLANNLLFDPQFDFHFYDMDFCRCARQHGLRLGTWSICLTHQSIGNFASEGWQQMYYQYFKKWGT
jgi:GT2 family glycosyltransferase